MFVGKLKDGGASGSVVCSEHFVARPAVEKSEGCFCSLDGEAGYFRVPAVRAEGRLSLVVVGGLAEENQFHSLPDRLGLAVRGRRTDTVPHAKTIMPPPNPAFQRTACGGR